MKLAIRMLSHFVLTAWLAIPLHAEEPIAPAPAEGDAVETVMTGATVQGKLVYVVPVRDDIDQSIVYVVRRGVKEAMNAGADVLILHMDTNGGRVDITEEIMGIVARFENQEETYTYIDTKAFSAGAFIASSTKHIYMAPSSVIGAAAPMLMGGAEMPESVEEKVLSAVRGLVRASAERHGHNPDVFEAMIDRDQGLEVEGEEIVPVGKILTLTSNEAAKEYGVPPRPLLSSGTVKNLDEFIEQIAGSDARVVKVEPTGLEQVSRFIVLISPLLFGGMLLFGYVELKTPGIGVFGLAAVLCALLFFLGHYIAGFTGHEYAVLFALGVVLVIVELFIFPGLILPGLIGAGLIFWALLKAMVDKYPTDPFLPTVPQLQLPILNLTFGVMIALVGILILARILPKTPLYGHLVLDTVVPDSIPIRSMPYREGQSGEAVTALRPSGTADFGQGPVDVTTEGEYITQGATVKISRIEGFRILVEAA